MQASDVTNHSLVFTHIQFLYAALGKISSHEENNRRHTYKCKLTLSLSPTNSDTQPYNLT